MGNRQPHPANQAAAIAMQKARTECALAGLNHEPYAEQLTELVILEVRKAQSPSRNGRAPGTRRPFCYPHAHSTAIPKYLLCRRRKTGSRNATKEAQHKRRAPNTIKLGSITETDQFLRYFPTAPDSLIIQPFSLLQKRNLNPCQIS